MFATEDACACSFNGILDCPAHFIVYSDVSCAISEELTVTDTSNLRKPCALSINSGISRAF